MTRAFPLLCMAAILGGCASMSHPLPKCDGYSRRPLNRAMWQWENNSDLKQKHSDQRPVTSPRMASYVEARKQLSAFAHLDFDASYRPCKG